jgi:hypothetical protein
MGTVPHLKNWDSVTFIESRVVFLPLTGLFIEYPFSLCLWMVNGVYCTRDTSVVTRFNSETQLEHTSMGSWSWVAMRPNLFIFKILIQGDKTLIHHPSGNPENLSDSVWRCCFASPQCPYNLIGLPPLLFTNDLPNRVLILTHEKFAWA